MSRVCYPQQGSDFNCNAQFATFRGSRRELTTADYDGKNDSRQAAQLRAIAGSNRHYWNVRVISGSYVASVYLLTASSKMFTLPDWKVPNRAAELRIVMMITVRFAG